MKSNYKYLLDPGHGCNTPGKESPVWSDGTKWEEGVGVRMIAQMVGNKLRRKGIAFEFTVHPNDCTDVSRPFRYSKVNELAKEDKCLCISIHTNASSSNPDASGREVWVATNASKESLEFADIWLEKQGKQFPSQRNRGIRKNNWDMVYKTTCPSVLLELEFHSNEQGCKSLMNETEKYADAIVESILEFESRC